MNNTNVRFLYIIFLQTSNREIKKERIFSNINFFSAGRISFLFQLFCKTLNIYLTGSVKQSWFYLTRRRRSIWPRGLANDKDSEIRY